MLDEMKRRLDGNTGIAVASSFSTNLEITDIQAQKGPVLKHISSRLGTRWMR